MFRIKKLDIFIAKQFGLLFLAAFVICQFVLMMQFLWRYVDELIGKGLSMDVLAQFFWYMGIMLMPQAFPLAILLSSLITFGNLGESSELTAIKAAGISLRQAMRSLTVITITIACISFYFQEVIGPKAFVSFQQLLISMQQKNPEVEIPEGIFYDGIPGSNLYVQKKDLDRGVLYGIMIYRMNNNYEDAAVILADSGRIQATAEKKHLLLTLYSGEWFENMRQSGLGVNANVPYRRETFATKKILLDFDGGFNLTEMGGISADARSKGLSRIVHDLDSIREFNDSVGHQNYHEAMQITYARAALNHSDSTKVEKAVAGQNELFDSLYQKLSADDKQRILTQASNDVQMTLTNLDFKAEYSYWLNREERMHMMEAINKFTLSLSCIIFFFIGAPLGAIIRKGGLGIPIIISVLVFIIYYILDNTGYRMARGGMWTIWFGKGIATAVLAPLAVFFTIKANNDSAVFNIDAYKNIMMRMLGLRIKRPNYGKEVVINDPDYEKDMAIMTQMNRDISTYSAQNRLTTPPNVMKTFFYYQPDNEIEHISNRLEDVIEDLSNSKDKIIVTTLSTYPIVAAKAHTRPFERRWMNIAAAVVVPVGLFLYVRMWRFRLRLYKDLKNISAANDTIIKEIKDKYVHCDDGNEQNSISI